MRAPGRPPLIESATWTSSASIVRGCHLFVVRLDAVDDRLRDAVAAGQLGAEDGVRALQLAVDRLADVVQEGAAAHDVDVAADLARRAWRRPDAVSTACMSWFWP